MKEQLTLWTLMKIKNKGVATFKDTYLHWKGLPWWTCLRYYPPTWWRLEGAKVHLLLNSDSWQSKQRAFARALSLSLVLLTFARFRSRNLVVNRGPLNYYCWDVKDIEGNIPSTPDQPRQRFVLSESRSQQAVALEPKIGPDRLTTSVYDSLFKPSWVHCVDHEESLFPHRVIRKVRDQLNCTGAPLLGGHRAWGEKCIFSQRNDIGSTLSLMFKCR